MYCNSCGSALNANQTVCGKCGNAVIGRITLSRVEQNVKLLGILWIAYALFEAIAGCIQLIVAHTIFGRYSSGEHPAFLHPLLSGIAVFLLVKAGLSLLSGLGLLERQSWARTLALVMALLALLNLPFGTALGVYTLWVLMSPHADIEYNRLVTSA